MCIRDSSFADPFADSEYTLRQQAYNNRRMTGRPGVYTPQMIVNGSYAAVGSQRRYVEHAIKTAEQMPLSIDVVSVDEGTSMDVSIDAGEFASKNSRADVWLATFDIERTTEITGGENKNLTLVNHHVVRNLRSLGQVNSDGFRSRVSPELTAGQGCALFVQGQLPGSVLAAVNCPNEVWR